MPPFLPMNAPYHHGDLRAAALQMGMERLESQEQPDLGLRALARDLGVSATALYRHFPNKGALLNALAKNGMEQLGQIQGQAAEKAGGGREGFAEMGIAYVTFAAENPALFRLIFSQAPSCDLLEGNVDDVGLAMRGLRENIAAVMPPDFPPAYRKVAALHAWSLVHGLAMLILDGQVEYDPEMVRNVVTATNFSDG